LEIPKGLTDFSAVPTTQHFAASSTISCGGVGGPFSASEEHRQATMAVGPVHLHRVPGGRGTSGPATTPATRRRHVLGEVTGCRLCLEIWRYRDLLQRRDGGEAIVNRPGLPEGTRDKAASHKLMSFPLPFLDLLKGY